MTWAADALAGLQRFLPGLRKALPTPWQFLRNWQSTCFPERALPMPPLVVTGLAGACKAVGRVDLACLLLIGFVGLLRTSELLSLSVDNVRIYSPCLMVIALLNTKSSRRKAGAEHVTIRDPVVILITQRVLQATPNHAALYKSSRPQFAREFRGLVQWARLSDPRWTPDSLRRGGTTWFFHSCKSMDSTILKGRWQAAVTARMYIEDAVAQAVSVTLSPTHTSLFRYLTAELIR